MNQRPQKKPPMGPPGPSNYYRPRYHHYYPYPGYRWPSHDYDYYREYDYNWDHDYDWGDYYRDEVIADNSTGVLSAYKQGLAEGRLEAQNLAQTGINTPPGYAGSMSASGYCGSTGA